MPRFRVGRWCPLQDLRGLVYTQLDSPHELLELPNPFQLVSVQGGDGEPLSLLDANCRRE